MLDSEFFCMYNQYESVVLFRKGIKMVTLKSIEDIRSFIKSNSLAVIVCATKSCNVCKPLKVKLKGISDQYEHCVIGEVYIDDVPEAQGEYGVYTAPISLVFVDGSETKRYSAAMDLMEFHSSIDRYENLLFS